MFGILHFFKGWLIRDEMQFFLKGGDKNRNHNK